ncbi:MAG: acyl carrier protein [Gammaproteobacteria bacterium]|nr:acyl carrier protein [Gammaproteobacteria bacterium]
MPTPSRESLLENIIAQLKQIKPDAGSLSADTDLVSDLGLDSVQVLEMCTDLEDDLDLSIPVNRLGEVRTAGQLADLLQQLLNEAD